MSKHVSADQKLHAKPAAKSLPRLTKGQLKHNASQPTGPPAGTNSKNQFR